VGLGGDPNECERRLVCERLSRGIRPWPINRVGRKE
jgi:hypothetical protein